jgi:thiol-disulfide isomerase/thioredoxin
MRKLLCAVIFSALCHVAGFGQAPQSSAELLEVAYGQAKKENKNVMVVFHASWCGWCRKMDKSLEDPACKKFFDKNYVIVHMVVYETKGKEQLETPGAEAFLASHQGNDQGLPYWIILDKKGERLADSKMEKTGSNTGCPATEDEVSHFISMLKKTSVLKEDELGIIRKRFRENEL